MRSHYQAIYLSPHLDDVALSCGGQIYQQTQAGEHVLIVTVTAGDPPHNAVSSYAQSLQVRWELLSDAAAGRRAEDETACRILGADWLHWDVPDCIYRHHPQTGAAFYRSDDHIFGEIHPAEYELIDRVTHLIAQLPSHDRIIAPLTVGHHVDHLLTRAAVERSCVDGLWYYEDYPYAQQAGKLEAALREHQQRWQPHIIRLTDEALRAKFEAIAAFRSQISTFWADRTALEREIGEYAAAVGGERLWKIE